MKRTYSHTAQRHFNEDRQMVFISGPRQVGKTTLCKGLSEGGYYLNWDNQEHRSLIIEGPARIAEVVGINQLQEKPLVIVFDEIHKYAKWKEFIKGFFDVYSPKARIVVTGSSRLDVFRKGGDSLMGRYFLYSLHPLSVREIIDPELADSEIQRPSEINPQDFETLYNFGGFPEPFIKEDQRFSNRWKKLRRQQLFTEDIRDFSNVQEIHQIGLMAELLKNQAGQLTNYTTLGNKTRVSVDTARRWIKVLESLYYCFSIQPWSQNVARSLLKQPKVYLWDWSLLDDPGARAENFVASHLLKAVHWWNDNGFGDYGLHFLRDKDKREVDFLVTKEKKPWFLVEVKKEQNKRIEKNLHYFQKTTEAPFAFQAVLSMDYVNADCFQTSEPTIVPLKTLLSQLA